MKNFSNKIIILIIAAVILAGLSRLAGGAAVEIRLRSCAEVKSGPICLADVAESIVAENYEQESRLKTLIIHTYSTDLANDSIGVFEITRALARAKINPATVDIFGAAFCRLVVEGARADSQSSTIAEVEPLENVSTEPLGPTLADKLTETVAELSGYAADRLKVEWQCGKREFLQLPAEENRFEIKPRSTATLGNVRFEVVDLNSTEAKVVDGSTAEKKSSICVQGTVQLMCESLVSARSLTPGEVITEDDVKITPRRVTSYRDIGFTNLESVIGYEVARHIPEHAVISADMIRKLRVIKRNDPVEVISRVGQISVTVRGEALADGCLNEIVPVRFGPNKTIVRARVTGPGQLAVIESENQPDQQQSIKRQGRQHQKVADVDASRNSKIAFAREMK
ncbi:MAG: flagellar basal body P-ring formation protein FlgA [Sedimentisphaerales bacterium]|nr:flagellar basal body P-ring formation protein FlgA [Sedimentisphaerales bacterium]